MGGGPPSPPGSVPPWITSGFSWSRVGLAKWFIRMQGSDTSRLACFFKDLQSILWQCFTWKARYCNASLLLSPLSLSPHPYLSSTSRASSLKGRRLVRAGRTQIASLSVRCVNLSFARRHFDCRNLQSFLADRDLFF